VATGERVLPELVTAYKKADEEKAFPVKWQNIELDQPKCQRKIMSLANEIKSHKEMQAQYKQLIDKLAAQKIKLAEARQKAADQIETIKMSREKVKVAQISEDLQKQLVDIKSVLQTSALDIASSSETGDVSLKDIQEKEASTVNMDEFNKIIGK
jgi:chromosome segregation ATPase